MVVSFPWDDDMDVVMMREDYERFLAVFNEVTGAEHMRAVSYRDKSAPCVFAKVVDVTTKVEERYSEARYGSGVWVDVFPLDAVPAENADKLFKGCAKYGALRYLTVTTPRRDRAVSSSLRRRSSARCSRGRGLTGMLARSTRSRVTLQSLATRRSSPISSPRRMRARF